VTPNADRSATPPSLTLSVVFGVVGAVLLVAAIVFSATAVFVAAFVAGTSSLISALYWRSQLIADWRAAHGQTRPPGGII
jgi:uncharacterized membrane protein YfcA